MAAAMSEDAPVLAGAFGEAGSESTLPLLLATCILTACALGSAWLAPDVPSILTELRSLMARWAEIHEVTREVDCRPWGLDRKFTITQDHATTSPAEDPLCSWAASSGRKWEFGLTVWTGALAMSRMLIQRRAELRTGAFAAGKRVIELGCGQALVSMVIAELFPDLACIVATDGSEEVLRAADDNVAVNLGDQGTKVDLAPLVWGKDGEVDRILELNDGKPFDVVVGADITYMEEVDVLVDCVVGLTHATSEVWITHEPRRRSTVPLLTRLRKEFKVVEETELSLAPEESKLAHKTTILQWYCTGKVSE